ncbi:MAG: PAS domain S-box protein [Candidatus Promineifilaceae bacterium]
MTKSHDAAALRRRAEQRLRKGKSEHLVPNADHDVHHLVHELQVHQIELEMQNEELRLALRELTEARDRYSDLYNFAPVGYLTLTSQSMIAEINLTAAAMLGAERKKLIQRRFDAFIALESRDAWHQYFSHMLQCDERQSIELALERSDGSRTDVLQDGARVETDGVATAVRITLTDISGRKQREEKIRKLSSAVEQSAASVIITDVQGTIEYVNASFTRVSGYGPEEAIGKTPRILMSGKMPVAIFEKLWQSILAGRIWQGEVCNKRKDGRLYWDAVSISPIRNPQGGITHFVGVQTDITERKQMEETLIENERRFRALFESAGDYALVLELQESGPPIIADGNRTFFEKHGYTRKELIGKPVTLLETTSSADQVADRIRKVKSGKTVRFEVEHLCKDGSTFFADAVARMVSDGVDLVYSVERDSTGRRRAEQEQQRLLTENRRLLQQLIRVQEEERRSLARDLHDELGQLLTSIGVRAEYIIRHADDADVRTAAADIARDTSASFDASHTTLLRLRPMTLDTLGLTAALTELTDKAKEKSGIHCDLHIAGKIDRLDDMHTITIYRLVQEALSNAHRHGQADRIEVTVRHTPPRRGQNGQVKITVRDNGKGRSETGAFEGMGIIGMRERVHALNGAFLITDIPHEGMSIEAILPLPGKGNR